MKIIKKGVWIVFTIFLILFALESESVDAHTVYVACVHSSTEV